jgi:chemotaxis protein CheZ
MTERIARTARDTETAQQNAGPSVRSAPARAVRGAPEALRLPSTQVAALKIGEFASERLPLARRELEALLAQSLSSIDSIMSAAEAIMTAMAERPDDYQTLVRDKVTDIFVACAFQDLTAQRGRRLNAILDSVEQRLTGLGAALASAAAEVAEHAEPVLTGPALPGDGNDQAAIDALLQAGAG